MVSRGWLLALSVGVVGMVRHGGGRWWSVVVVVWLLSVSHRCQLPLLVMAVTVTHLVVGAARHCHHPRAHCSEAHTSMGLTVVPFEQVT